MNKSISSFAILVTLLSNSSQLFANIEEDFTFKFRGRALADRAWFDDTPSPGGPIFVHGSDMRALRLGAHGNLDSNCKYKVEFEFSDGEIEYRDMVISLNTPDGFQAKLGQFKPYFSIEELTSRLSITFLERALVNTFVPGRRLGVGFDFTQEMKPDIKYNISLGVHGESISDTSISGGNQGTNTTLYLAGLSSVNDTCFSLLGLNVSYTKTPQSNQLRYNSRPEIAPTDNKLVDTGTINNAQSAWAIGLNSAFQAGPLGIQAEIITNKVNRAYQENLNFYGYYVFLSYFFTNESRKLNSSLKQFKSISINRSTGAIEGTLRYSYLTLDDKDIMGGHESNITLGLNWYVNEYVRIMGNIIAVSSLKNNIKSSPTILGVRVQGSFS